MDIDNDVLAVASDLAQQCGKSACQIISQLARQALEPAVAPRIRNGVPLPSPKPLDLTLVNQLRDDA